MKDEIRKGLPIGVDDFKDMVENNYYFIDKSLFIKELIDDSSKVKLLTRPRRFGKTLNLSMTKYYFEKTEADSSRLFNNLKIWQAGERYRNEQGKYPVIYITLKEVKENNFDSCIRSFQNKIIDLFIHHDYLLSCDVIREVDKTKYKAIISQEASVEDFKTSLYFLSMLLYEYFNSPVIILIDEYDTMINNAVIKGYFIEATDLMRIFLGAALKGNTYLKMAVVTGIYRVAKESIFSDINNLDVSSVLTDTFTDKFGFVQEDVEELANYYGIADSKEGIKLWYNGYIFGEATTVYNPWSLLNYIKYKKFQPYWVNTSTNELIKNIFYKTDSKVKEKLKLLLQNEDIKNATIDSSINFRDILDRKILSEEILWSFLVISGYLKFQNSTLNEDGEFICDLSIPNKELRSLFKNIVKGWFNNEEVSSSVIKDLLQDLAYGNIKAFEKAFRYIVNKTFSFFDVGINTSENFYHAFTLGLLVNLDGNYRVFSNRELGRIASSGAKRNDQPGKGRPDVLILPKDSSKKAVIIEFKTSDEEKDLEADAETALKQIEEKEYIQEAINSGINDFVKLGIAFCKKEFVIKSRI